MLFVDALVDSAIVRYNTTTMPLTQITLPFSFSEGVALPVARPSEVAVALPNTPNTLAEEDYAAHNWFRFVLSFPPHLVRQYLNAWDIRATNRPQALVLDPFCGTGTTLVECKKMGIGSIGVEASPFAHFTATAKVAWKQDALGLRSLAEQIAHQTEPLQNITDTPLRTLPEASESLLLRNSISAVPLHKILALREEIARQGNRLHLPHLWLALAQVAVGTASNLKFGPEVGVGRIREDAPVLHAWREQVEAIATDLPCLHPFAEVPAHVLRGDARYMGRHLRPQSIDAVFTSPPYPNEKDYSRTTRLETVLLGFANNRDELRAIKKELLCSNTRTVYKGDTDDTWVRDSVVVQNLAEAIETRRVEMNKTSGFERLYGRVTRLYFGGMARHLAEIRPFLRPGARLGYVVGDQASYLRVMIRTGQVLAEIAQSLGYRVLSIDLFRTRFATATKSLLREEVLVLQWPGETS